METSKRMATQLQTFLAILSMRLMKSLFLAQRLKREFLFSFYLHFKIITYLNKIKNRLKNDGNKTNELRARFDKIGLHLDAVRSVSTPTDTVQQLFLILFIVACVILIALVILLSFLLIRGAEYVFKRFICYKNNIFLLSFYKRLDRKVKALSSTKFGSQDSGLNRKLGATIPNTNMHTTEGSNPIWSMDQEYSKDEDNQFDNTRYFNRP